MPEEQFLVQITLVPPLQSQLPYLHVLTKKTLRRPFQTWYCASIWQQEARGLLAERSRTATCGDAHVVYQATL